MASSIADASVEVRQAFQRTFAAGEVIFDEGDTGGGLYVIQAGEVEFTRSSASGRRLVGRLGPGEFFGEMSVVLGGERRVRAVAATQVRLFELDSQMVEGMCSDRPEVAFRMIRRLAGRVIDLEQRLAALGTDDLLVPIVRVLLRRAEPKGDDGVRIPATLRQLADESGLSMREAHRALRQLFDQKLLRLVEDVLIAENLEALSASLDSQD